MTVLLATMTRGQGLDGILLVSMAVVGSIRVASYYNEALSTDLAKILPFALLGILLIDSSIVSLSGALEKSQRGAGAVGDHALLPGGHCSLGVRVANSVDYLLQPVGPGSQSGAGEGRQGTGAAASWHRTDARRTFCLIGCLTDQAP